MTLHESNQPSFVRWCANFRRLQIFNGEGGLSREKRRTLRGFLCLFATALALSFVAPSKVRAHDTFLGEVFLTAIGFCPRGTFDAAGDTINIHGHSVSSTGLPSDFSALFSIYGTRFGGDGAVNFQLPDMRTNRSAPFPYWEMRWCVQDGGRRYPSRPTGAAAVGAAPSGVIRTFGGNFCPEGWRDIGGAPQPHVGSLTRCAGGNTINFYEYAYDLGRVIEFQANSCPRDMAPTNGALFQIRENPALYSLLGTSYGGDGGTTFALPTLASNEPGKIWCIVTNGLFPHRS